ncbi:MAG: DUF72 domain-containing protein [Thermoplasmatota archaeon]
MTSPDPRVRVGTCGWSYDDWVGPFYPRAIRDRSDAWLAYYADRFSCVEIDSTFYRTPAPGVVEAWARKASEADASFEFQVKLPEHVTHVLLPAGRVAEAAEEVRAFDARVLAPLEHAGHLGLAVAQLAPAFHANAVSIRALAGLLAALPGRRVAVEFRHASWLPPEGRDAAEPLVGDAVDVLRRFDATLVATDSPDATGRFFRDWVEHARAPVVGRGGAYVRFHGRNAAAWSREEGASANRYDYLYARLELAPWLAVARRLAERHAEARLLFNNHPEGKAPRNATEAIAELGEFALRPEGAMARGGQARLDGF